MSDDQFGRFLADPQVEELYVTGGTIVAVNRSGQRSMIGPDLSDAEVVAMLERLAAGGGHDA